MPSFSTTPPSAGGISFGLTRETSKMSTSLPNLHAAALAGATLDPTLMMLPETTSRRSQMKQVQWLQRRTRAPKVGMATIGSTLGATYRSWPPEPPRRPTCLSKSASTGMMELGSYNVGRARAKLELVQALETKDGTSQLRRLEHSTSTHVNRSNKSIRVDIENAKFKASELQRRLGMDKDESAQAAEECFRKASCAQAIYNLPADDPSAAQKMARKKRARKHTQPLVGMESRRLRRKGEGNAATQLHDACARGDLQAVKSLLQAGTSAEVPDPDTGGDRPLHTACAFGRKEVVEFLVEEQQVDVHAEGDFSHSAAHAAAKEGHAEILEYLARKGVDMNKARVFSKLTPLMVAVYRNHLAAVECLLRLGVDVEAQGQFGTALHIAARPDHPARGEENTLDIARVLVEANASTNLRNSAGLTPLMLAAEGGDQAMVEQLVQLGCSVTARSKQGLFAWELAKENNHDNIVAILQFEGDGDPWDDAPHSKSFLKNYAARYVLKATAKAALKQGLASGKLEVAFKQLKK